MRNLKRVLSLALALVMVLGMMVIGTSAATFADDAEVEYKEAIEVMAGIGVFKGDDKGNVNPDDILTRKDAATIVARIHSRNKVENLKATKPIFSDVPTTEWYAKYVEYCYNTGLIAGNGDGTYSPDGKLTGIAFAKLLLVALGYDADEQGYVGLDWSSNIAVDALANDLYIKGVDIAEELTREQAAQMLLQVLDEQRVRYENSFDKATGEPILSGPYKMTKSVQVDVDEWENKPYTFMDEYYPGLTKNEIDGTLDNWGRPYDYKWTYKAKTLWTEKYDYVTYYTEAVTECDIAEELGLDEPTFAKVTVNGKEASATYLNGNNKIDPLGVGAYVGAQGRLTEIYDTDNGYVVVMIDTFLAKVDKVTDRTYDKNGHLKSNAKLDLTIYDEYGTAVVLESATADYDYTKGDMLLVYAETTGTGAIKVSTAEGIQCVEILGVVEGTAGKLNAYNTVYETSKIDGETYSWANQYNLGNHGDAGKTYIVYEDMYGNLIGLATPGTPDAVYTILDSGVAVTNGFNPFYAAKILDMTTGELVEVKVASYAPADNSEKLIYWVDNDVEALNHIVTYSETKAGYALADADVAKVASDVNITAGTPRIYVNDSVVAVTDNKTVFVVEVAEGEFKLYTGYKNVPSIKDAKNVEILVGSDGYVDMIYIDAIGAIYTGAADVVYVLSNDVADIGNGVEGSVAYDMYGGIVVNGEKTIVNTTKTFDLSAYAGMAVTLFYNADGLVFNAAPYTFDYADETVEFNHSDEVVYFVGLKNGYIVDDATVIWVIDEAAGTVKVGAAKDLAAETENVYMDVAKDGKTLEFVVIIE